MRGPHNLWRLIRTGATFERTGAMKVALEAMDVPPRLRLLARVLGRPFRWLGYRGDPALPPVTRAITALGPAYIKFGQVLSTRPDVVGEELSNQLRVLQDKLPPFDIDTAKATVAAELGRPPAELFSAFSEPVAAASIAQVHRASLADSGADVAVKILRPGIERAFRRDIDAFYFAASLIEALSPASRRLRPTQVIAHFEGVVMSDTVQGLFRVVQPSLCLALAGTEKEEKRARKKVMIERRCDEVDVAIYIAEQMSAKRNRSATRN